MKHGYEIYTPKLEGNQQSHNHYGDQYSFSEIDEAERTQDSQTFERAWLGPQVRHTMPKGTRKAGQMAEGDTVIKPDSSRDR